MMGRVLDSQDTGKTLAEEDVMQPETSLTEPRDSVQLPPIQDTPSENSAPETSQTAAKSARRTKIFIIAAAVIFLGLLITAIVLMALNEEATRVIRDIAIVFVAVETFLIGLAAILLIFQIQMLIQVLRDEIQPLLESFNDTASTVRGTTEFVSDNVVSPIIKAAGFAAGARRVTSDVWAVVTSLRPRSKPSKKSSK
jgi:hypothetical protein